jgi:hypothetical protein
MPGSKESGVKEKIANPFVRFSVSSSGMLDQAARDAAARQGS